MVTFAGIRDARPQNWKDAADDYEAVAKYANQAARDIRHQKAAKVDEHWADHTGRLATDRLRRLADQLDSAYDLLYAVKMVLEGMHTSIQTAQSTLDDALELARAHNLDLDEAGRLSVCRADTAAFESEYNQLRDHAIKQATDADEKARGELAKLRTGVSVVDPEEALKLQEQASHTEMDALAGTVPTSADPETVRIWWNGLDKKQQHELMLAEPVALSRLNGVPESVKRELRGTDGKFDRTKMVDYALTHWNKPDDVDFGNNCTNFVSESLWAAGMQPKFDPWWGPNGDDTWGKESGIGIDAWDRSMYYSHSWGGAENQQNFMLRHGGEEVPRDRVRPGDIIYYEQQGQNEEIDRGETHHAAVVTGVTPDGEIKYTQHTDSHQNVSLEGRLPHEAAEEGRQNVRIVRPHPDWY